MKCYCQSAINDAINVFKTTWNKQYKVNGATSCIMLRVVILCCIYSSFFPLICIHQTFIEALFCLFVRLFVAAYRVQLLLNWPDAQQ